MLVPRVPLFALAAGCAAVFGCSGPRANDVTPEVAISAPPPGDRWEFNRRRYNRLYADPDQTVVEDEPSGFLLECLDRLAESGLRNGAIAIDVGAGSGRNSLVLAAAGYRVIAIDIAETGLDRLRERARTRGLPVETVHADVYSAPLPRDAFDLIALIYFAPRPVLFDALNAATRPGGAIVVEGFEHACQPDGVPIPERFVGWSVLRYEVTDERPDWRWRQDQGSARIVRFLAIKPEGG
ncbi:MAG: methyltransferase domain-containing protein [Phycisphaerales bacterium]|nr:methyltransferase domain-containing protein [Phycisphaerales bacterium]